jgi:Fur family ferric uptake transcriptional regulator
MIEDWDRRLRAHGFRITPQRHLVLDAIYTLRHGTPDEILAEVLRHSTGVNLSTIYRAIEVLEQVGLVTHSHIGHGAPTYHAVDSHTHIHLACDSCDTVEAISADVLEPLVRSLRADKGFEVDVSHVAFHGRCRACVEAGRTGRH